MTCHVYMCGCLDAATLCASACHPISSAERGVQGLLDGDSHGDSIAYLRLQAKGLLERGVQPLGAWALGQTLDAMSLYRLV